jgi:hypothetical protein
MVIIENDGEGFFTYALGTVEEGDPYIDDAYKGQLPATEASVSELMNEIRDGFGLGEDASLSELDIKKKSLTTQKMPNDIIMLVHKLKKNVPLRPDEYQKLLAYKAFRKESMQTQEDAAGVGIITKQNSTVDVNKGTPRKNLKAFRLVK